MDLQLEYLYTLLQATDTLTIMSKRALAGTLEAHDRASAAFLWRGLVSNHQIRLHLLGRLARLPASGEDRGLIRDWCRAQQAREHPLDQQAMQALRRLAPDPEWNRSPR